jgi:hypothetical protein
VIHDGFSFVFVFRLWVKSENRWKTQHIQANMYERNIVMIDMPRADRVLRRLRVVRWVAFADLVLLVALVSCSLSGARDLVRILGPLHGGNFLLLLTVVGTAAADGLWSWWFPAAVFLTGGPVGALVGEWMIRRQVAGNQGGESLHLKHATRPLPSEEEHHL